MIRSCFNNKICILLILFYFIQQMPCMNLVFNQFFSGNCILQQAPAKVIFLHVHVTMLLCPVIYLSCTNVNIPGNCADCISCTTYTYSFIFIFIIMIMQTDFYPIIVQEIKEISTFNKYHIKQLKKICYRPICTSKQLKISIGLL